ncbi:nucleotide-binding universal stress UspA family protein [Alkalispirillum mobile]|uniref:Nucleotide-binding universal stress UspA family protein n=1 Tax=Alkalispirillum mobile TaxID=85925 RepID=A0A498C6T7_9GAMM|nr:universal stress protein [Alkalispirillum mobile]RLK51442.1 nucleotide-binding universal stress UspA family protein [Alkalispirillum mobile]
MGSIVVGVDGSEGSRRALLVALEEAKLRKLALRAIYVLDRRYLDPEWGALISPPIKELEKEAKAIVEKLVASVADEAKGVDVQQEVVLAEKHGTARTLLDHGSDATMLVVGSRGHGGFSGLLLGSVSHQVLQFANCPVLVVPQGGH